jgi:hypothetical protein
MERGGNMTKAAQYQAIFGIFNWEHSLDANGNFLDIMDSLSVNSDNSHNGPASGFRYYFDDDSWLIINFMYQENDRIKIVATMAGPQIET